MSDTDLNGLDIIADDQQAVKAHRAVVKRVATHTLTQGLHAMDRVKVCNLKKEKKNYIFLLYRLRLTVICNK